MYLILKPVMMILFVWQPIGWIGLQSCRVIQIRKLQNKNNTKRG